MQPIATAPVKPGEYFGPVLLFEARAAQKGEVERALHTGWTLGRWEGEGWGDLDMALISPTHWCPLGGSAAFAEPRGIAAGLGERDRDRARCVS